MEKAQVSRWTCDQVEEWLIQNKFDSYTYLMCKLHKIDGQALLALTEKDLREQLEVKIYGDVKRLNSSIERLKHEDPVAAGLQENGKTGSTLIEIPPEVSARKNWTPEGFFDSLPDDDNEGDHFSIQPPPKSEPFKALVSFIYFLTAFFTTTFVLTVVHNRIPDPKTYPPLPDIFLDSISRLPWAFKVCEGFITFQSMTLLVVLFLHKHRLIILRRAFALYGTLFALRSVTMLVTSLPIPGKHLETECSPKLYDDIWAQLDRALEIGRGMGMSSNGITTCGDYIFSGHTATLTLSSFFITEYTPARLFLLHITTRVMNWLGMVAILFSKEHYSIDILIAWYITARLFACYHTLANGDGIETLARGGSRKRACFPVFSYFEKNVKGRVPNQYEWPLSWPWWIKHRIG